MGVMFPPLVRVFAFTHDVHDPRPGGLLSEIGREQAHASALLLVCCAAFDWTSLPCCLPIQQYTGRTVRDHLEGYIHATVHYLP